MKFSKLLLAGSCLVLGFSAPAAADLGVSTNAGVKVDTKTDVTTDKVLNAQGDVVSETTTTTTTKSYRDQITPTMQMDRDAYVVYSYEMIDYDHDGMIDEGEWRDYTTIWYEPVDVVYDTETHTFVSYDVNKDGFIDATEYNNAYDVDLFAAWDADSSGTVDATEYQTITTTYRDLDKDGIYDWVNVKKETNMN